jgi:uncharacterized lipoprotein YehR (DUF1307 family)
MESGSLLQRKEDRVKGFIGKMCAAAVLVVSLALVGCEINKGAYDACKPGMTKEEVKGFMAQKPWIESKDTLVYQGDNVIKVQFDFDENGKLKSKEWIDKTSF